MFVIGITFYGMSTFEGPLLSLKSVNALSHYTDWTIGHVHAGALGWNGFMTFGALNFLTPRLWGKEALDSLSAVSWHVWLATIGIVRYASSISALVISVARSSCGSLARLSRRSKK